ncbi:MAG: hypothetical protein ACQKBT_04475 [Puniceicoccales bacterium]
MKSIPAFVFALLLLPFCLSGQTSAVRQTYEEFDNLMLAKDGNQAFELLSSDSKAFVAKVRGLANTADSETLLKEPLPVVLAVFSVRSAAGGTPPTGDGETLVEMARGYEESSAMTEMGNITIDGDTASGEILVNGNPNPIDYAFVKEDGVWKVDMASQMEDTEKVMMGPVEAAGLSREQFLNQIADAMQTEFSVDVWQPIEG